MMRKLEDMLKQSIDLLEDTKQLTKMLRLLDAQQDFVLWVAEKHPRILREWNNRKPLG